MNFQSGLSTHVSKGILNIEDKMEFAKGWADLMNFQAHLALDPEKAIKGLNAGKFGKTYSPDSGAA